MYISPYIPTFLPISLYSCIYPYIYPYFSLFPHISVYISISVYLSVSIHIFIHISSYIRIFLYSIINVHKNCHIQNPIAARQRMMQGSEERASRGEAPLDIDVCLCLYLCVRILAYLSLYFCMLLCVSPSVPPPVPRLYTGRGRGETRKGLPRELSVSLCPCLSVSLFSYIHIPLYPLTFPYILVSTSLGISRCLCIWICVRVFGKR